MSVATALTNVVRNNGILDRHRDRMQSERVEQHDDDYNNDEEGSFINQNSSVIANNDENTDIEEGVINADNDSILEEGDLSSDAEEEPGVNSFTASVPNVTLAELEEEREMARRRSSACVLFALFVLFRLWLLALEKGELIWLVLCLIGTSYMARWIRYNHDQEQELDRRIANYLAENNTNTESPADLRMLSFQAQLALAIMESQRQAMQGGVFGNTDAPSQGVSDAAKQSWTKFLWDEETHAKTYGSVVDDDDDLKKPMAATEAPHCSICLGEYEQGEELMQLPVCKHVYHAECIASWTENHVRCPLCNLDLEGQQQSVGASV